MGCEIFILPSIRRQISSASVDRFSAVKVDKTYFLKRTSDLSEMDRHVVLQIDEIYTAQRVEYTGGNIVGLSENGSVAKTGLNFMVTSLSSHYEDVIMLIPMDRLNALLMKDIFFSIMKEIQSFVCVVGISTDNLATNR